MMKMLLYGLLIYFLYKVIFEIVVPVSRGVRSVRQNMDAEYIDFEEVKKK